METLDIQKYQREIESLLSRCNHLQDGIKSIREKIQKCEDHIEALEETQSILQMLAQSTQNSAHEKISRIVSSCLSSVFDRPYKFHIEFERKRGKTEAVLSFRRGSLEVDPLTGSGGGVVDVAAFALRVACLVLRRPALSRLLVLDEPFRFVSEEYQPNIRTMLEALAEETGIQFIICTHIDEISSGKIIRL